jgi:hypothetical protein
MEKIFKCIDDYMSTLETEIMNIVSDQSIPLMEKNKLMEPIADQKKVLTYTKASLESIKNKEYEAKCGLGERNARK